MIKLEDVITKRANITSQPRITSKAKCTPKYISSPWNIYSLNFDIDQSFLQLKKLPTFIQINWKFWNVTDCTFFNIWPFQQIFRKIHILTSSQYLFYVKTSVFYCQFYICILEYCSIEWMNSLLKPTYWRPLLSFFVKLLISLDTFVKVCIWSWSFQMKSIVFSVRSESFVPLVL